MSNPTPSSPSASNQAGATDPGPQDPWDALLFNIAGQIAPLFRNHENDAAFARKAAMSALAAYHPESRADFVSIARILAFSMATLTLLGVAVAEDVPPALKMRYFGRANALSRSADQSERLMMRRRRDQRAHPPAELPADLAPQASNPGPMSDDSAPNDPAIDAAIEEAMAAHRAAQSAAQSAASAARKADPAPFPTAGLQPGPETTDTRAAYPQPSPAAAAIRAAMPLPRQKPPYRQSLLQRSAMPRIAGLQIPVPS